MSLLRTDQFDNQLIIDVDVWIEARKIVYVYWLWLFVFQSCKKCIILWLTEIIWCHSVAWVWQWPNQWFIRWTRSWYRWDIQACSCLITLKIEDGKKFVAIDWVIEGWCEPNCQQFLPYYQSWPVDVSVEELIMLLECCPSSELLWIETALDEHSEING